MKSDSKTLTKEEREEYFQLKIEIHGDLTTAAEKLKRVYDNKLYEAEYKTWAAFVEAEFGWKRAHAYRMLKVGPVRLSPIGDKIKSEGQARALNKVPEEHREEVINCIEQSGAEVTAKAIEITAEELLAEKAKSDR